MDFSVLYFISLLLVILYNVIRNRLNKGEKPTVNQLNTRRSSRLSRNSDSSDRPSSPSLLSQHIQLNELRSLSLDELERKDILHGKQTDRYWREMFRRHNEQHPPDLVSLDRLSVQSVIRVLEECIPQGFPHFTITGIDPKVNCQTHVATLKHLRKRYPPATHEICVDADKIEVRTAEKKTL